MNRKCTILAILLLLPGFHVFAQSGAFGTIKGNALDFYYTGRDLESQGKTQEAETWYSQAMRICTEEIAQNNANRDTYTALVWTCLRQQKYNDAITWGERGMRFYNDEYRILEAMGEASFYLDDYENSLKYMQRYVNSLPR